MEKITLNVIGLNCGRCETKIVNALKELGANDVSANRTNGEVSVEYNPNAVSLEDIKKGIVDVGYDIA